MENDLLLWQKFKNGDRAVFESMIREHYRALFDYGKKLIANHEALTDCIHDVFTTLWDRREFLGTTDQIKPYLLKSLRNRILKEKQRSNVFIPLENGDALFLNEEDIESRIISSEHTDETKKQIGYVLHTLTPRQQEIIYLKFYENLTNDQIATVLGITRPAVANLLHITLKLFREKWETLLHTILLFILLI
ncbi:sigma-70 family RNA polymerase sigma factor [Dyadobacter sp. LJ53]|uniref:RNA polymerase sigma factor n=1 Tax=Dyadobacter chenwenxiniae TaxID=2906456 RepID=UPI001F352E44|nr:sigma-70 family RNA polymerase sigma factor [Dyadobacter chenwenxiniae]MCF0052174.1 sigma-70 family RNA polymerase sigma factor [Dyadobacter chenwenxiniae]